MTVHFAATYSNALKEGAYSYMGAYVVGNNNKKHRDAADVCVVF